MSDFGVPCGLFFFIFFLGFFTSRWFFRQRYIVPLEYRMQQLERRFGGKKTIQQPQQAKKQLPSKTTTRVRYVPVEQQAI